MARDDFLPTVEGELRLRHVPFDHRRLREFTDAMFPLAFDGDNAAWWADTFLEAMGTEPGLRDLGRAPAAALYAAGAN